MYLFFRNFRCQQFNITKKVSTKSNGKQLLCERSCKVDESIAYFDHKKTTLSYVPVFSKLMESS